VLDLVGDVRDDLYGRAQVVTAALLGDHTLVDATGREIAVARGHGAHEALVMAEVQVGLGAVGGDEHFAVLERAHGAWIDVDVRIQLHHADPEAARFENGAQRGCRDAFPERGNDTAGHTDITRHLEHRR
jgi:hypothetical protein